MDKYELVLDIIEHPHNYTSHELEVMLEDPETREIYNLLCKTDSAMEAEKEVDIDAEWIAFSRKAGFFSRGFRMRGRRAASIIGIICTSIVAMAIGIAVTIAVTEHNKVTPPIEKKIERSAVSVAAPSKDVNLNVETPAIKEVSGSSILFEDEPLSVIMDTICTVYGVEATFDNEEVGSLHLYYKFDPSLDLDEVVEQLNTFESISITKEGKTLTID